MIFILPVVPVIVFMKAESAPSGYWCNFTCTHLHAMQQTLTTGPTADYVSQIKRRVQDNLTAREDREKRRRRVLVEQLKAMHEQEVSVCVYNNNIVWIELFLSLIKF